MVCKRIGVDGYGTEAANKQYRFYIAGNENVSVVDKKAEKSMMDHQLSSSPSSWIFQFLWVSFDLFISCYCCCCCCCCCCCFYLWFDPYNKFLITWIHFLLFWNSTIGWIWNFPKKLNEKRKKSKNNCDNINTYCHLK